MRAALLLLLAAFLGGPSCDEDGAPPPADAGRISVPTLWAGYCTQEVQREMGCGQMPDPQGCAEEGVCMENIAVPEYVPPLIECLNRRRCDESDDDCYEQAAQRGAARATVNTSTSTCLAKHQACADDRGPFICSVLGMAHDAFLQQVDGCLAQPCPTLGSCLESLLRSNGC